MRLLSIASGSSGNCIYIGSGDSHILVDAGISGKRIESGLNENGLTTKDVQGILITHEHSDHVSGLGVLARKYGIPMYGTPETLEALQYNSALGNIPEGLFRPVHADREFQIEDLTVHPFSIPHDARNPVAYRVSSRRHAVAVATDMGDFDDYIISNLSGLDAVLLEANHDVNMLQTGKYPYPLKRRILSDRGHLSNETSGKLLVKILHDNLKYIFLGHLSRENNYEELAYETVCLEISMGSGRYSGKDFPIQVARRDRPSALVTV